VTEKQSKHRENLANAKQIPSILPDYILPLTGAVNHERIPRDYEYTLITAYISNGIRIVVSQLGQIPSLKNSYFNLGNRKNYAMIAPHRYLLGQGQTQGSTLTVHQQALTIVPFGNTYEADAVSPEVAIGGCRTQASTTRGNAMWI
jgi:hypothetical protein